MAFQHITPYQFMLQAIRDYCCTTQFGVKSLWQSGEGRCTNTKQKEDYYHRVEFHIWNTNVQLYLSHTWPHSHISMGYKLFPVPASNTLRVNERHSWRNPRHHSYHIIQTFPSAAFTSQWVIVPITLHFLSREGLCCVVAFRAHHTAAWHATH